MLSFKFKFILICRHRESKVSEISYKGVAAKTPVHKAEQFNAFFSSVFTFPRSNIGEDTVDNSLPIRTELNLSDIAIGVDEVANCLHGLDTSKASGPDGLPSRLLKECAQQIAPSLCTLFNHSLQCGRMPLEWKSANITPLHEKQLKEPAENYRPISLLPIVSKVLACIPNFTNTSLISSLRINTVFYEIVPALHNYSPCFIL